MSVRLCGCVKNCDGRLEPGGRERRGWQPLSKIMTDEFYFAASMLSRALMKRGSLGSTVELKPLTLLPSRLTMYL